MTCPPTLTACRQCSTLGAAAICPECEVELNRPRYVIAPYNQLTRKWTDAEEAIYLRYVSRRERRARIRRAIARFFAWLRPMRRPGAADHEKETEPVGWVP